MCKMTDHCDVQFFFLGLNEALPLHGCDVMRFGVMRLWFDLLLNDTTSCEIICGCTPIYYSKSTLYYKVLLQYYSVLQSTTKYYSSTTKYYTTTTLYYKVL